MKKAPLVNSNEAIFSIYFSKSLKVICLLHSPCQSFKQHQTKT